jgi:hypothetical protein
LFHAFFFNRKIKPYYRTNESAPRSRFIKIDGEYKRWELGECLKQFYGDDVENPTRKNLEFFIPLRNKIEHRSFAVIDSLIFGEAQSMLLNFDAMMEKEFGVKYCIHELLSFALQIYPTSGNLVEAVRQNPSIKSAVDFITSYRSSISSETWNSDQYAFKAFMIPIANNESRDSLAVHFINYDKLSDEEKTKVDSIGTLVKNKMQPVINAGCLKASDVVKRVREVLGDIKVTHGTSTKPISKYNQDWHRRCWKHFNVRPSWHDAHPEKTDLKYCTYDKLHNDYAYTHAWVKLLIENFRNDTIYNQLYTKA